MAAFASHKNRPSSTTTVIAAHFAVAQFMAVFAERKNQRYVVASKNHPYRRGTTPIPALPLMWLLLRTILRLPASLSATRTVPLVASLWLGHQPQEPSPWQPTTLET